MGFPGSEIQARDINKSFKGDTDVRGKLQKQCETTGMKSHKLLPFTLFGLQRAPLA